jgi:hypothetical protein
LQTIATFTLSGPGGTVLSVALPDVRCHNVDSCMPLVLGRRLLSTNKCVSSYYRVLSVLTGVTLQVALPAGCAAGGGSSLFFQRVVAGRTTLLRPRC